MKKHRGLLKFVIAASAVLFVGTVLLLYLAAQRQENDRYIVIDPDTLRLVQFEEPKEGDPVAIIDTTLGEIKIVLYPDRSPNAVKNFTELAESGWYDNTYVYNSVEGICAYAGSKQKNGEFPDGYDVEQHERVERELDQDLWPFRGAVCMVNTYKKTSLKTRLVGGGTYYNGSCFAFLDTVELTDDMKKQLLEASGKQELGQAFVDKGGVPNLSQQVTVIGQTYEGLDVIDALTSLETENNGKYTIPKEDIMINSVKIASYPADGDKKQ